MKRLLALLLAAGLVLMLGGCRTAEPAETEPTAAVTEWTTLPTIPATLPTIPSTEESASVPVTEPDLAEDAFVRVTKYIPEIRQELRYATENNFTGQKIYDFPDVYLRWGTVKKLWAVSDELAELGLGLKIWDGFRPVSAQFRLWQVCPDPTYVANPEKGFSSHSRGNTVDLTLVDLEGNELEMPTGFDDFTAKADRDYSDCSETAAENARLLESVMEKYGFSGYFGEWWHYTDTQDYPVEEVFEPPVSLG